MHTLNKKYLALVKKSLMGGLDTSRPESWHFNIASAQSFKAFMTNGNVRTLIGPKRLDHIEECILHIINQHVAGDIVEAGCWRGGALIYLKACLDTYEVTNPKQRTIWGADLFPKANQLITSAAKVKLIKSLLKIRKLLTLKQKQKLANRIMEAFPNEAYEHTTLNKIFAFANSLAHVEKETLISTTHQDVLEAFKRYDLHDEHIKLMPGWFQDTLPIMSQTINKIAILRLDADFYQSTLDALTHLYPKVSANGICIIDDYGGFIECKKAVDEYRFQHQITEPLVSVDGTCYYWVVK